MSDAADGAEPEIPDGAGGDALPGRCGSCAAFVGVHDHPSLGKVGHCALEVYPPPVKATSTCTRYRPKGAGAAAPRPRAAGEPRRYRASPSVPPPRLVGGDEPHALGVRGVPAVPGRGASTPHFARPLPKEIDIDMDMDEFRRVLRQVLSEELGLGDAELGRRWQGGELIFRPGVVDTQEKRVPIETFFHKIVMLRDKLRVLEAKLNASDRLSDEEKVQLQSYVTACYGTLTSFNALFADPKGDGFSSKK